MTAYEDVTVDYLFDKHVLNAADDNDLGTICVGCLEPFPCDAFLAACRIDEMQIRHAEIIADLIKQRDALLGSQRSDI